jgi:Sec-independent protein translocase protein TatA
MLVRALIDHIPPIFGCKKFSEVANNYGGGTKSFRKQMEHLDNSLRNIADAVLHEHVRKKESLPTHTQIDFRADIDVLLQEIVRVLSSPDTNTTP